jgi:hypothetical protein
MRVAELKDELQTLNVNYNDCFDRESLIARLQEARAGGVSGVVEEESVPNVPVGNSPPTNLEETQAEYTIEELRTWRVKDLRKELGKLAGQRSMGGLLEKEDIVQAVWEARQAAARFSVSGKMTPGLVTDLTDKEVFVEVSSKDGDAIPGRPPLLLDVYATW